MADRPDDVVDAKLDELLAFIKESRGFDFASYKPASIIRRIRKRMQEVGIEDYERYRDHLEVHPDEFVPLFDTILINVTSFFRDPEAWRYLADEIIPAIIEGKDPGDPIRAWTAGCASGEETYTLAMLLAEALGLDEFRRRVKIYATDIDDDALAQARQASYTTKGLEPVPEALRKKYFEPFGTRFVFRPDLRRTIIFGRHDLLADPPMSRVDLLVCRNTLMYFNADAQSHVLARFQFALNGQGALFLGKSEMLLTHGHLFTPVDLHHRVFRARPATAQQDRPAPDIGVSAVRLGELVDLRGAAFDRAPMAQLVIDHDWQLVLANDDARTTFGLDARDIGRPFQDLEVSYRPLELRSIIERAYDHKRSQTVTDVIRHLEAGEVQRFDVVVEPLGAHETPLGVLVVFEDVTAQSALRTDLERSGHELETAYEELQSTNEELETTNEELQSTIEELETTNEELQSTNEELETMNEELQSTNAELGAASVEINRRRDEVQTVNAFLETILSSLTLGVVVLDPELTVLVWNEGSERLWGLRADEVRGHSFLGLDIGLPVDELARTLRDCLAGTNHKHEVILDATNRTGKAIHCGVTCAPRRDVDDVIAGVVLTMSSWEPSQDG